MQGVVISVEDPLASDVVDLLEQHLELMHATTPICEVYALAPHLLAAPDVTFFGARRGSALVAVGALKAIDERHGELKSMHTARAARGHGLGRAMLDHLLTVARDRSYDRVSLETGTMAAFSPARSLYTSVGFKRCPPFGDYAESPNSVCMTLHLDDRR